MVMVKYKPKMNLVVRPRVRANFSIFLWFYSGKRGFWRYLFLIMVIPIFQWCAPVEIPKQDPAQEILEISLKTWQSFARELSKLIHLESGM